MTNRIHLLTAMLALAGCSSAAQESPNTAVVVQGGPELASAFDAAPADDPLLDGAPPIAPPPIEPAPVAPPVVTLAPKQDAPAPVQRANISFSCDIDIDRTSGGIRVTPIVHADRSMSGEYSLVITKDGSGGSSDISQGGPFSAARGERVELSSSEFSMERGASFRATLKVRSDGREVCRDVRS